MTTSVINPRNVGDSANEDVNLPFTLCVTALLLPLTVFLLYIGFSWTYSLFAGAGGDNEPLPPPAGLAHAGGPTGSFGPELDDCRPAGDCASTKIIVREVDYEAFNLHLQRAARIHGGGYEFSHWDRGYPFRRDDDRDRVYYFLRLPPDIAAELRALHQEDPSLWTRIRHFNPVLTSPGYREWALRWSREPDSAKVAGAADAFETLSVSLEDTSFVRFVYMNGISALIFALVCASIAISGATHIARRALGR